MGLPLSINCVSRIYHAAGLFHPIRHRAAQNGAAGGPRDTRTARNPLEINETYAEHMPIARHRYGRLTRDAPNRSASIVAVAPTPIVGRRRRPTLRPLPMHIPVAAVVTLLSVPVWTQAPPAPFAMSGSAALVSIAS